MQGPDTDQNTVQQIRDAIAARKDITVQLLNYTKSGKPFWNLFHLQAMRDQNGELQYFIGVQLDGSEYVEPERKRLSEKTEKEGSKMVGFTHYLNFPLTSFLFSFVSPTQLPNSAFKTAHLVYHFTSWIFAVLELGSHHYEI